MTTLTSCTMSLCSHPHMHFSPMGYCVQVSLEHCLSAWDSWMAAQELGHCMHNSLRLDLWKLRHSLWDF